MLDYPIVTVTAFLALVACRSVPHPAERPTVDFGPPGIHPEAIIVAPDGASVAVLSHEFGGEFSDHFEVRSIRTATLAHDAYAAAAREREREGDAGAAADLFALAARAGGAR